MERLINLPGARVSVAETGWTGPPIVVVPGAGGSAVEWAEVADLLSPRLVVRVDRPGLGDSPAAPVARDALAESEQLLATLHAADVAPPYVLVGHSLSGMTCRAFAYRHPEQTAALVLVDPFDEDTDDDALPRGFETMQQIGLRITAVLAGIGFRGLLARATAAAARRILSRPDRPGTRQRLLEIAHAATNPAALRAQADAAAAVPTSRRQLRELTASAPFPAVPVRVLTPDRPPVNRLDRLVRAQNLTELHPREAAASPRGSHHVVTGSSHMVYLDQPEALAEHISIAANT